MRRECSGSLSRRAKITATLVRQLDSRTVAVSATSVVTAVSEARDGSVGRWVRRGRLFLVRAFASPFASAGRGDRDGTVNRVIGGRAASPFAAGQRRRFPYSGGRLSPAAGARRDR